MKSPWFHNPGPKLNPEYEKALMGDRKPKRIDPVASLPPVLKEFEEKFREQVEETVKKYNLAVEELTEKQVAEVILQALASGDLMKYVVVGTPHRQAVTYIPYREHERLQSRIRHLEQLLAEHGIMEEAHAIT